MSELLINTKENRERRATPIYIEIQPAPTEEQMELLKIEFQKVLQRTLEAGEKIPYTDAGSERVQQLFSEAYERILPKYQILIVTVAR